MGVIREMTPFDERRDTLLKIFATFQILTPTPRGKGEIGGQLGQNEHFCVLFYVYVYVYDTNRAGKQSSNQE